jgi:Winged helix DNA-binding domain
MDSLRLLPILKRCVRAHGLSTPAASLEEAAQRAAGVYGSAPTCYLSTAVRTEGFQVDMMQDALIVRRSLVRIPAMRGSVYLLPRDFVPAGLAIAKASGGAR